MAHRILSIDGGGSRALIPVCLLHRMLEVENTLLDEVDVIAGTSTSGITALIVAHAYNPRDGLDTARRLWIQGAKLFSNSGAEFDLKASLTELSKPIESPEVLWDRSKHLLTAPKLRGLSALTGLCAYFTQDELKSSLEDIFGDATIGDLQRKVLLPSINLGGEDDEQWGPELIHNLDNSYASMRLVEAALRIAAMPILFPLHHHYADAAMLVNNPALTAVSKMLECHPSQLRDMRVLSVGTGDNPISLYGSDQDLGYAGWLMDHKIPLALMQAAIETNGQLTDYHCSQILPARNYHRINPKLARTWLMHEHRAQFIVEATDIAEDTPIEMTIEWLRKSGWIASAARSSQSAAS